jgi:CheY-like chemotaxis protein
LTAPPDHLRGLRLLLVEDEAIVAMMLEDMLADLGCVVVGVAGSVASGLAMADEAAPLDGAVLDVNLGGEAVYPIAEALRARGVPFVFSTGYAGAGVAAAYAGVPVLAKPYGPRALAAGLTDILRKAPLAEG